MQPTTYLAFSFTGTGPLHAMNPVRIRYISDRLACSLSTTAPLESGIRTDETPYKETNTSAHKKRDTQALAQAQAVKTKPGTDGFPLRNLRILDVGCGGGLASEALARLGARVVAIDPSPENIRVARAHSQGSHSDRALLNNPIDYRCVTAEELLLSLNNPESPVSVTTTSSSSSSSNSSSSSTTTSPEDKEHDGLFDAVVALEVLEHVPKLEGFLASLSALVRPGGSLFLSTINRTPQSYAVAIVGAEYVCRLLPPGTHDWNAFKVSCSFCSRMLFTAYTYSYLYGHIYIYV